MPSPTLVSMAQRACVRDIAGLEDIGDMSYELAEPILRKITNPNQLRKIEIASPHISDHSADLWKALIARDIPRWQEKIVEPKNPRSWWKVYRKLIREEQKEKEESEQQLMAAMQGIQQEKDAHKLNIVRKVLSEPTRSRPLFADGVPNPYVNGSGTLKRPVLKNAKTGRDIIHALRKQSNSATKERNLVTKPAAQPVRAMIKPARSQITKAPPSMIRDHQQQQLTPAAQQMKAEHVTKPMPKIFASRSTPSRADKEITDALRAEQAKKEDRLRALASGKPTTPLSTPSAGQRPAARNSATLLNSTPSTTKPAPMASPSAALKVAGEASKLASPSPTPQIIRKRPAPSIFMPAKKRKV